MPQRITPLLLSAFCFSVWTWPDRASVDPAVIELVVAPASAPGTAHRAPAPVLPLLETAARPAPRAPGEAPQSVPLTAPQAPDLEPDWALFSEGRMAEIHASFATRRAADPGWTPTPGLERALEEADARTRVSNAVSIGQVKFAARLLDAHPDLVTCDHVWFGWAAALTLAGLNDERGAVDLLERVDQTCTMSEDDLRAGLTRVAYQAKPASAEYIFNSLTGRLDPGFERELRLIIARGHIARWSAAQDAAFEARRAAATDPLEEILRKFPEIPAGQEVLQAAALIENQEGWIAQSDQELLAWFFYNNGAPEKAVHHFSAGAEALDPPKRREFARGETLARIQARDFLAAEAVLPALAAIDRAGYIDEEAYPLALTNLIAHTRRDEDSPLFADIWSLPPEVRARAEEAAHALEDADLFQQIGWLEHRSANCGAALPWFRKALARDETKEEAAWGMALCLMGEGQHADLELLRAAWAAQSARIAGLVGAGGVLWTLPAPRPQELENAAYSAPLRGAALAALLPEIEALAEAQPRRAAATARPSRPAAQAARPAPAAAPARAPAAASGCRPSADPAGMSPERALSHGWCMMELSRPFEAIAAFDVAARSSRAATRQDAAYGRSLALMRKGLTAEASAAIRSGPNAPTRFQEIDSAAVMADAISAYNRGANREAVALFERRAALGPMPLDVVVLQGWALFKIGRRYDARQIWRMASQAGSADAVQALRDTD